MQINSPQEIERLLKEGWNDMSWNYVFSNETVGYIIEAVRRDALDPQHGVNDEQWQKLAKRLKGNV